MAILRFEEDFGINDGRISSGRRGRSTTGGGKPAGDFDGHGGQGGHAQREVRSVYHAGLTFDLGSGTDLKVCQTRPAGPAEVYRRCFPPASFPPLPPMSSPAVPAG